MMDEEPRATVPSAIEQVLTGLEDLEVVLGEGGRGALPAVREGLVRAIAARDQGDPVRAFECIGQAMDRLSEVAGQLDPREAVLMRAVAAGFRAALLRGDEGDAKRHADAMFRKSGARKREEKA